MNYQEIERRMDALNHHLGIDPEARYSIKEVCESAGVDPARIMQWIEEGKIDIRWTGPHRADARFTEATVQRIKQLAGGV